MEIDLEGFYDFFKQIVPAYHIIKIYTLFGKTTKYVYFNYMSVVQLVNLFACLVNLS